MNIKLEIDGEKYEIETVFYGVDGNELPDIGYEIFGFNPDGGSVLLGDNADDITGSHEDAAIEAFSHLIEMIYSGKIDTED